MESFSLDLGIDPELREVMQDLATEVYGDENESQISQLSVSQPESDSEDENTETEDTDQEEHLRHIVQEYIEYHPGMQEEEDDENQPENHQERDTDSTAAILECGCSRICFSLFPNPNVIEDYRLNIAEFTREEKEILILSKLEQMEYSSEGTRKGKRVCQRFSYVFQGQVMCETAWRYIHDIGKTLHVLLLVYYYFIKYAMVGTTITVRQIYFI